MTIRTDQDRERWLQQQDRGAFLRQAIDIAMDGLYVEYDILGVLRQLRRDVNTDFTTLNAAIAALSTEVNSGDVIQNTILNLVTAASGVPALLQQLIASSGGDHVAVSVRFAVTTHKTLQGVPIHMAQNIIDDMVTIIPIEFDNLGQTAVAKPAGSTDTVTVDSPAFTVAMSADGLSVEITPVQPATDGTTGNVTYTNSAITTPSVLAIVISPDATAVSDHFDTLHVTTRALPAAPPAGP